MHNKVPGSAMIIFVVLIPLCIVLAYNLYYASLYYVRTIDNIQDLRIERKLTEGLLHVGCTVCCHNKVMLLKWANDQARIMHLTFPVWPSSNKNSLLPYSGTISIMSEKGFITVSCILQRENRNRMSGSCTMMCQNPKNIASELIIKHWSIN